MVTSHLDHEVADEPLDVETQLTSFERPNLSDYFIGNFLHRNVQQHEATHLINPTAVSSYNVESALIQAPLTIAPPAAHCSYQNASGYGTLSDTECLRADFDSSESTVPREIVKHELFVLTKYTVPIFATHLLELSLSVVSVLSLGHLGTSQLAAASLAGMTANVTGFSMLSGIVSALDTLLPAAFTRNPKMMGLWTQRMGVVMACTVPLIMIIWLNAEKVLIFFGQEPEIARQARQFLAVLSIGLPGHAVFELSRRYLQAQGLMHAPTVALFVVSPLNALANYLFVWGPKSIRMGFIGAPLASAISMWLMAVMCFLQCVVASKDTWDGWSSKAFDIFGLKVCISLGCAGLLSIASEWWAWEIVGLATAALGTIALASQSVLLITSSIMYQLPGAAAVAASVRVGNLLGLAKVKSAQMTCRAALVQSITLGLFNSAVLYIGRHSIGYAFSSDPAVIASVAAVMPIMALFQLADCICGIASGILRGSGHQGRSATINVTAYYLIGIPASFFLTFGHAQIGLHGLWWGLTIALIYGSLFGIWSVAMLDWDAAVNRVNLDA